METNRITELENEVKKYKEYIKNAYKKFGRTFEKYAPFTDKFTKEEKENLIFLGKPIDAISFCEDRIVFIEIKTGNSFRTPNQERIKQLIEKNKVEFREVRY